ncbi:MAG: ABC transporter ATP-binding protein [Ruminococcus sp.]|nr:ABC transporter ATP-binding protein [Candidatus Copronaster equi]
MKKRTESFSSLFKKMTSEWKWLMQYIKRYVWYILLYCVIGIVATVMGLGISVISKNLIDSVVNHNTDTIVRCAVTAILFALFQIVFTSFSSWITTVIGTRINNEIRSQIYTKIVRGKWTEINEYHSGELINRLEGDVSTVSNGVISFIPNVLTRAAKFFGALGIVLYYDKTMAVLALISAPFLFICTRFTVKTIRKFNQESRELNGKVLSFSEESLQNIQVIKAFNLTGQYINNFKSLINTYRKVTLEYQKFSIIMTFLLSVIGIAVSYACYGWGVYRLWQNVITYGTMTLFLSLSGTLNSSFGALISLAPSAVSIATSAGRIKELTEHSMEEDKDEAKALNVLESANNSDLYIKANNVSFTYKDGNKTVLDSINFEAKSGETIAFIGSSGEGKTTVLRLLLGLVEPDSGNIEIRTEEGEKVEISDSTRRFFSYVPQNMNMFSGTIAKNLRIVKPDATDEELIEVLKTADIWDYISSLTHGLNTEINERGINFSEGQLQRISIARALLRKSKILVLDETTSALDVETENHVLENMMISQPDIIRIITTHRPSMLEYCDRIYKIDEDGHVSLISNRKPDGDD